MRLSPVWIAALIGVIGACGSPSTIAGVTPTLGVGIASLATIPLMLVLAPIGGLFGWRPPIAYELAFGGVLLLMPLLAISAVAMGHITVRRNKADGSAKMALAIGYAVLGLTVLVIGLWFVWELAMTR